MILIMVTNNNYNASYEYLPRQLHVFSTFWKKKHVEVLLNTIPPHLSFLVATETPGPIFRSSALNACLGSHVPCNGSSFVGSLFGQIYNSIGYHFPVFMTLETWSWHDAKTSSRFGMMPTLSSLVAAEIVDMVSGIISGDKIDIMITISFQWRPNFI